MMVIMYIEYIYLIKHYFKVIRKDEASFDLYLPIIITLVGSALLYFSHASISSDNTKDLLQTIITLLSILVGFTIASIAILTTAAEHLNKITERFIGKKQINLYQLSTIFFIFSLFSEIITLIIDLSALVLIFYNEKMIINHLNVIVILNVLLVSHILFITIRNITNFYFIIHSSKSGSS